MTQKPRNEEEENKLPEGDLHVDLPGSNNIVITEQPTVKPQATTPLTAELIPVLSVPPVLDITKIPLMVVKTVPPLLHENPPVLESEIIPPVVILSPPVENVVPQLESAASLETLPPKREPLHRFPLGINTTACCLMKYIKLIKWYICFRDNAKICTLAGCGRGCRHQ